MGCFKDCVLNIKISFEARIGHTAHTHQRRDTGLGTLWVVRGVPRPQGNILKRQSVYTPRRQSGDGDDGLGDWCDAARSVPGHRENTEV